MNRGQRYQAVMVLVIVLFVLGLGYCGYIASKEQDTAGKHMDQATTVSPNYDRSFTGVVKALDLENQTVSILGTDNSVQLNFKYNGGTDVRNQYGKVISIKAITLGEIVDFTYDSQTNKLKTLTINKDAWTYENVKKMKMDTNHGILQLGEKNYAVKEGILYVGDNEIIEFSDLSSKDQFTIKGIGDTVYSIIVTKGHGVLRFTNIDDFIGGTVYISASTYQRVLEQPLSVEVREGSYKVVMQNGKLTGIKQVTVERGKELTIDMSEFKLDKAKVGDVTFAISPYGADLYIDGKAVDYSKTVSLNYGNHKIEVQLNGYKSFSGVLTVGQQEQDIEVSLVPDTSEEESQGSDDVTSTGDQTDKDDDIVLDWDSDKVDKTDKEETEPSKQPSQGTPASTAPESSSPSSPAGSGIDTLHKITVSEPEKVEVYVDDAYKGMTPVSFTKVLGSHRITLKKKGYTSKTYTIHVEDNNENVFYTFAELEKD